MVQNFAFCTMLSFLSRNKDSWPKWVIASLIATSAAVLSGMVLSVTHPAAGEIWGNILIHCFGWGAATFAALFVVLVFPFIVRPALLDKEEEEIQKALPASVAPALSGDVVVCRQEGETEADFVSRAEYESARAAAAVWVAVIPFRYPEAIVYKGGEKYVAFPRECPPFDIPEEKLPPENMDWTTEDGDEYRNYCTWFDYHFRRWSSGAKIEADKENGSSVFLQNIRARALATSVLLLIVFSLFGQSKTRQVDEALGTRIREIPRPGEDVVFVFQEGSKEKYYNRTGDGRREYTELLKNTGGLFPYNDNGGQLLYIKKGSEIVARASQVERVNTQPGLGYATESATGDPVRPRGIPTADQVRDIPRTDSPVNFSIPDSATSAAMADRVGEQIQSAGRSVGKLAMPWWRVAMNTVWMVAPLLGLIATLLWVWAGVSASEGMIRLHKVSRRGLVYVLLGLASVLAINAVLELMVSGAGVLLIWLVCIVLGLIAYFTITRIVPNFNPAPGNEPERGQIPGGFYPGKRLN